ncbi:MAG: hypothetical protein GTO63_00660 [Anaerolineae bacterium]|nr:hypothetical protein [Anaerolineae bacterium]NIQ76591.1 hypothetical protein [Anaerolineae bacterium]
MERFSAYAALLRLKSSYACFCEAMEAHYAEPGLITRETGPIVDWMAGETALMEQSYRELMDRGVYTFLTRNWIFMAPPLIIDEQELKQGLAAIDELSSIADKAVG